ncbi:glycerol-3-phosphate acyltransferase [Agrilactobacillus fermenti]|uniref:glycerol-3-phosphate acyltransferase n=1 Tax=Agrilactobacillus fermenti TaxID=2586909 RepID=UPI003A5C510D
MKIFYSILIGYFLGNFLFAYVISYLKTGQSPTTFGSGNPGTANVGAVLGKQYGILVLIFDLAKTVLAMWLSYLLFPALGRMVILYAGLGVTLGHNFPIWLKFKGGKGVAVAVAIVLLYNPLWGLVSLLVALALLLVTKYLALGGIAILLADTILGLFFYSKSAWVILLLLTLIMIFRFWSDLVDIRYQRAKKVDLLQRFKK